jgi:hypothetical protein
MHDSNGAVSRCPHPWLDCLKAISYKGAMEELRPASEFQMIRDEVKAEHSLISNRLAWYVTSQSFLVTAFAISRGAGFRWFGWFSTVLLPLIGLLSSLLIFPSIMAARKTIHLWHLKQVRFFELHPEFKKAFELRHHSRLHAESLLFPTWMPVLFGIFWLVLIIASRLF